MAKREGMAGCMRARWQLLGVVREAWSRSSRWWAGRGQIRQQGAVRGQIGAAMARWGWGTVGKMVAVGHWGGIQDRA